MKFIIRGTRIVIYKLREIYNIKDIPDAASANNKRPRNGRGTRAYIRTTPIEPEYKQWLTELTLVF